MSKYYTVEELYNIKEYSTDFMKAFESLSPGAKQIVLEKNAWLNDRINKPDDSIYDDLDFSKKRINVSKLIIRECSTNKFCPVHVIKMKQITVGMKVDRKMVGAVFDACLECKRLYTNNLQERIDWLEKLNVKYEVLYEGDY